MGFLNMFENEHILYAHRIFYNNRNLMTSTIPEKLSIMQVVEFGGVSLEKIGERISPQCKGIVEEGRVWSRSCAPTVYEPALSSPSGRPIRHTVSARFLQVCSYRRIPSMLQ